jgi:hypothetical protein
MSTSIDKDGEERVVLKFNSNFLWFSYQEFQLGISWEEYMRMNYYNYRGQPFEFDEEDFRLFHEKRMKKLNGVE